VAVAVGGDPDRSVTEADRYHLERELEAPVGRRRLVTAWFLNGHEALALQALEHRSSTACSLVR